MRSYRHADNQAPNMAVSLKHLCHFCAGFERNLVREPFDRIQSTPMTTLPVASSVRPVVERALPLSSACGKCRLLIFRSIQHARWWWCQVQPADDHFLRVDYLAALEAAAPQGMEFRYLVVLEEGQPLGLIYTQLMPFRTDKSLRPEVAGAECSWQALLRHFKSCLARKIALDGLVCGNLLLTGEHAFHFLPRVEERSALELVHLSLDLLTDRLDERARRSTVVLVKDFPAARSRVTAAFLEKQYQLAAFQPNMVLRLRPHWHSFDDYLADMSSKYRVRARRAAKKAAGLQRRTLDRYEIAARSDALFLLYRRVAEQADFNAFLLHPQYFLRLKEALADDFVLTGWFDQGRLVGFNTAVRNGSRLEAHFLGYEPAYNPSRQIYLNMLYHLVELALELQVEQLVLGRTALEIKSSIGAEPEEMNCFLKHRSTLPNSLLPSLIDCLEPKVEWVQRKPFKGKQKDPACADRRV